ncbi:RagB/SusD family nutrient uptake outer membrane protein [Chitinophaga sp. MM2321]|uniref:RagB/SusD family nutrient uptake outer membrane protein n=1 Tax=Chitinophaga sp. MM2321 TaxID=3137178 RepID=UPI0032D56A30
MIKKIFIISFIIIIAGGCGKDPLDITPDGRTTLKDVFSDNDQTGAYLNSCYAFLQKYGIRYFHFMFLAALSDEAHDSDDPTENLTATAWYKGTLTPSNNPLGNNRGDDNGNYYGTAWQGIRKCNVFLANIDNAKVTNPADAARWKAEAKVLRAYYYWELIKMYGGMPVVDKPFDLTADFVNLKRDAFNDCVQFIVKDCKEAIAEPQLPWRITTGETDRSRFTKAVAYAIMSEATLFNASPLWNPDNNVEKWQQAATLSKEALDALTGNGFMLASDYRNYFLTTPDLGANPADKETILQLKNSDVMDALTNFNGIPSISPYKGGSTPSQELVDAYEMKNGQPPITGYADADHLHPVINTASGYDETDPYVNRDPRFYATVFYNNAYYGTINGVPHYIESHVDGTDGIRNNDRKHTHNGYYLHKFIDASLRNDQGSSAKWRRYRLAEIYLNYAEALNEAYGTTPEAYDAVNAIRSRPSVSMPPLSGLTKEQFRQRVRNERRVELAFEENRFWDVRRWKILDQTDKLTTGMQWTKVAANSFAGKRIVVDRRQSWAEKFHVFPIPSTEIITMPLFVQNPGW